MIDNPFYIHWKKRKKGEKTGMNERKINVCVIQYNNEKIYSTQFFFLNCKIIIIYFILTGKKGRENMLKRGILGITFFVQYCIIKKKVYKKVQMIDSAGYKNK